MPDGAMKTERATPRQSRSDRAYATLRGRLRRGEFMPGECLSEGALARDLGMSRTPVREAIQRLAQEGHLHVFPRRGIVVSSLSLADVHEIYAVREVLEGLAARLCAVLSAPGDVTRLRSILERSETVVDDEHCVESLTELDHEFHAEIARQARNRRLQSLLTNMRDADLLQQHGRGDALHVRRYRTSVDEHRTVLDAIAAGKSVAAEEAMRQHCRSAARFVADYVFCAGESESGVGSALTGRSSS